MTSAEYSPCDLCGAGNPRLVLESDTLDGPLVQCGNCGLKYIGRRNRGLTFGQGGIVETAEKVRQANVGFRHLRLDEEHRLAVLNARWRLDLIRSMRPSGRLLEVGCARGDFLSEAKQFFDVCGVEPSPELADFAEKVAPVHRDVIEKTPWSGFDVIASFHVIEHVDSPNRFVAAIAERLKPGGLVALETPDIDSLPFRLLRHRWRQFIPEHYYFFDSQSIRRLLSQNGFTVEGIARVGKHASVDFLLNRLSRYFRPLRHIENAGRTLGLSRLTFRVNPMDIMIVFATKNNPRSS
jgi:2-polyprenyl-3-methyl-5-hydroxy-6-metoxy-1,4-benzoquinol methylase